MPDLKAKTQELLSLANIKINGSRPWDIKVFNKDFYKRVFSQGGPKTTANDKKWRKENLISIQRRAKKENAENNPNVIDDRRKRVNEKTFV